LTLKNDFINTFCEIRLVETTTSMNAGGDYDLHERVVRVFLLFAAFTARPALAEHQRVEGPRVYLGFRD